MEHIKISIIFITGIFDGIMFLLLEPIYYYALLPVHFLLFLIIQLLSKNLPDKYVGIPNYLVLFLPVVGGIVVSLLYFSLYYFQKDSIVLDDYERYLQFERYIGEQKKVNYDKEIRTISFSDQMDLLDTSRKKELIVDYTMDIHKDKLDILQKGLLDEDSEVRHYSAVTINMFENKFTFATNKLREEFNLYQDLDTLIKLSKAYEEYIGSGLLSDEFLMVINEEYIDVLLKILERKHNNPKILDSLVKAYIRSENFFKAEEMNERLISTHPDLCEGFMNQLHIAIKKQAFHKINSILAEIRNRTFKNQEKFDSHISFWIKKEGIV